MNGNSNKSKQKKQTNKNILESLSGIGQSVADTAKNEAAAISDEFFKQLLGQQKKSQEKKSGEIQKGSSLNVSETVSGEGEKRKKLQEQMFFERRLASEEKQETNKKLQELRLRLQAMQEEANRLISSTQNLTEELKVAVFQNVVNPSEYQVSFFENIIATIISFRKKIDSTITWLQGSNKRAEKKNYWSQYKKKGSSFLLSGESYLQRSVG